MPRVYGNRNREMYWQRDGKWLHLYSSGRTFDTLDEARDDYIKTAPGGLADPFVGYVLVMMILAFVVSLILR